MKEWRVVTRLAVLAGVLSSLLIAIGGFGLWGMQRAEGGMASIYKDHLDPALELAGITDRLMGTRLALTIAVHTREAATQSLQLSVIESNLNELEGQWKSYLQRMKDVEGARLTKAFSQAMDTFVSGGLRATLSELEGNNAERARRLLVEAAGPLFLSLRQANQDLQKYHALEARRMFLEAQDRNAKLRGAFLAAIAGGVCFAITFGAWIVWSLTRQLGAEPSAAADVARRVAAGELSKPIIVKVGAEGSLMAQLKRMQESLANIVHGVRHGAETVSTASEAIARGNVDLRLRTEQQASALQQTAASMEQLGAAARQNSDNALHAAQLAMSASEIAMAGGQVVGKVVQTMGGINTSSNQIAGIIGVIDELAFQTNILALNAAVEAARAGEQGRGFAVVAGEVRNLAQRSGNAAREIKQLIAEGVERVDRGMAEVQHAGSTMQEIVDAITRVSSIVKEISAASAEQSAGVRQLSEAVTQIDEVTQKNTVLVEESAASAEHLKTQAQNLVQAVSVFNLMAN